MRAPDLAADRRTRLHPPAVSTPVRRVRDEVRDSVAVVAASLALSSAVVVLLAALRWVAG